MECTKRQIFRIRHTLNVQIKHIVLIIMALLVLSVSKVNSQSLWVGETYKCDATSAVMGLTSDVDWSTSGGYLSLSGSGFYRNVKVTQYFSGSATVKCTWRYRLYSGDSWKTSSRSWSISCKDNPVSIYPITMNLYSGETGNLSYSFSYNNSYTSYADAYYSSSNPNVATVTAGGVVTAKNPGTAYITLYSKISHDSPYCTVKVTDKPDDIIKPSSVSIPASKKIKIGETVKLIPTVNPSNAVTTFTWKSSDVSIATVPSLGTVKGISEGMAIITVTTDNWKTAECLVTVIDDSVADPDEGSDSDDADFADKLKRAKTKIDALKSKSLKYLDK